MQKSTNLKRKHKNKDALFIILMLALPVTQFLIFWLYVNIDTLFLSFQRFDFTAGKDIWVGFQNYVELFDFYILIKDSVIVQATINSILFFPFNNFILLPISLIFAYFLFIKIKGSKIFRVIFFFPSVISVVVLTMVFKSMFSSGYGIIPDILQRLGLESWIPMGGFFGNTKSVMPMIFLYCLWAGIGYNIVLINGAMLRIPPDILEAGKIDGANMRTELFRIVFPIIYPTISMLFILGVSTVFTLFLQPKLLTDGGPDGASTTIAMLIVDRVQGARQNIYEAATIGVLVTVIGVPIILAIKSLMDRFGDQIET